MSDTQTCEVEAVLMLHNLEYWNYIYSNR